MDIPRSCVSAPAKRFREAGWNRAQKLLRKGIAMTLWLASDAENAFAETVTATCRKAMVTPDRSKTGKQLASMAGVEVFTAVLCEYEAEERILR